MDNEQLVNLLRPLGFYNRRAATLKKMSNAWLAEEKRIPGTGKYANDSNELFFGETIPDDITDGVLVKYAEWRKTQEWKNLTDLLSKTFESENENV